MHGNFEGKAISCIFYDSTTNGNPIAKYQVVSWATTAQVSTANTAGIRGVAGDICVVAPITSNLPTSRILGVTLNSAKDGCEVLVAQIGVVKVMCNAAVAFGARVFPVVETTRTSAQTPFTSESVFDALLPVPPGFTYTYNLGMIDDPALTPAAGGSNVLMYPLGWACEAATAQYNIINVELDRTAIYV